MRDCMSKQKEELLKKIKKSINLPKTSFPMKANLAQNESISLKRWKKQDLYAVLCERFKDNPPFIFHDGPPYANGHIHAGHLLNKVLKDFVVRSQFLLGKLCQFIPGWDCHGLPIEHKVMQTLTESGKIKKLIDLPPDSQKMAIRNECCSYAKKYIKLQSSEMKSLLTIADYNAPYLTMTKQYEASTLDVFSELVKKQLVYRKLKPVHWSIANQTALADAELEYFDKKDSSVFVSFNLQKNSAFNALFSEYTPSVSIVIWTTTPWTLPANLAIALHKDSSYSLVNAENKLYIIATELVDPLSKTLNMTFKTLKKMQGSELTNLQYHHPFIEKTGPIVHADFVSLEDGSGFVHIAPGHGTDDYLVGLEHGLDPYCPVLEDGSFDTSAPDWLHGKLVWDANPIIIDHLRNSDHLLHEHDFIHSYPHDWRSKTPVIFRSTEQWFIGVDIPFDSSQDSLRQRALDAIDHSIEFIPDWGKNRLKGMLESRPDWCISRQRSWGLPIPAFKSKNSVLLTKQSISAIAAVFKEEGSDAWFKKTASELLSHYNPESDPDFPQDFILSKAEKMYDIFDVWFESGSSWNAVLNHRQQQFPADLYLEGSDQHRGWFHLSLLPSLGVNHIPPYKKLLTHGFIVDKNGHKMSKSTGNALNVQDLLSQYGAEVMRWWVSSLSYENDIKVDLSFFNISSESYRKIRNTLRFLLSNVTHSDTPPSLDDLHSFVEQIPKHCLEYYVLGKISQYSHDISKAYENYQFKHVHSLLYECCNDLLSSFYCSISKDCLYCDSLDSPKRKRIQLTFHVILECLCRWLNPILPHTSEEAYHAIYGDPSLSLPLANSFSLSGTYDLSYWEPLMNARQLSLKLLEEHKSKGIENSLDAGLVLPNTLSNFDTEHFNLSDFFGVSRVSFHDHDHLSIQDLRSEPRCDRSWKRDITVKERSCGIFLSERDAKALQIN
ncbi:isoleucine--tRNA ligase [Candidatus Marinamargulisbacteria bacterium SCGC AG-343-D04]|nr:isoleucine--tRNA ligase [Candidatus Marinamargulisbacteria bacterium SCGC AG-343-D04]